jgi:hypothetical protein
MKPGARHLGERRLPESPSLLHLGLFDKDFAMNAVIAKLRRLLLSDVGPAAIGTAVRLALMIVACFSMGTLDGGAWL